MLPIEFVIIIPCYNEDQRLALNEVENFINCHDNVHLCFIDDYSTDSTYDILIRLQAIFSARISLIKNKENKGKAESIRNGLHYCIENSIGQYFAYLDADFATSLDECYSYLNYLINGKKFVFASRILKIGSVVERKYHRFLFGRIIATIISNILQIKVYDTQCGCKVFDREIAEIAFQKPFISKWLFDVEIFSRILKHYGKEAALEIMEEIPVKRWVDRGESKVKLSYFFKLWIDLLRIRKEHKR